MQSSCDRYVSATRLWAGIVAILLIGMMSVSLVTGVAQEPFEIVRDPGVYRADLIASAGWLKPILAMDSLFIIAYVCFFLCFARAAGAYGDQGMLRLGVVAILAVAQWLAFLGGFIGAAMIVGRYSIRDSGQPEATREISHA